MCDESYRRTRSAPGEESASLDLVFFFARMGFYTMQTFTFRVGFGPIYGNRMFKKESDMAKMWMKNILAEVFCLGHHSKLLSHRSSLLRRRHPRRRDLLHPSQRMRCTRAVGYGHWCKGCRKRFQQSFRECDGQEACAHQNYAHGCIEECIQSACAQRALFSIIRLVEASMAVLDLLYPCAVFDSGSCSEQDLCYCRK